MKKTILFGVIAALWLDAAVAADTEKNNIIKNPLDVPAQLSELAEHSRLVGTALTDSGKIVAVGERGHILVSQDGGASWKQSQVPVSSALVAVHFASEMKGWAVGHEGVVLATEDGGVTWKVSLNGRGFAEAMGGFYQGLPTAGDALIEQSQSEAERFIEEGADKPFLDVWFENEEAGWVVGAFNLILRTENGGRDWQPWMHRTDNQDGYSYYAIREVEGAIYLVGELGMLLRLDPEQNRFVTVDNPSTGTLFGVVGHGDVIVAFGLEGSAIRSRDRGESWEELETGLSGGITDGTYLADGRLVLVTTAGDVGISDDDGTSFASLDYGQPMPLSAVVETPDNNLLLLGSEGALVAPTPAMAKK